MEKTRPVKQATLCLIIDGERILLGMKKRGFGVGKYNGFGGKPDPKKDNSIEQTALRELAEESGLTAANPEKVGEIDFYFPHKPEFNQTVHIYLARQYSGEPRETDEMAFEWFNLAEIPYHQMWDDDKYWLPRVLQGKKLRASVIFKQQGADNIVDTHEIQEVNAF